MKQTILFCMIFACMQLTAKCLMSGKIKYIYNKKEVIELGGYCFTQSHILSLNCVEKKCLANKSYAIEQKLFQSVGNPLFKFCLQAKGIPQIMWFWNKRQWVKTARCIFKKDRSYIDLDRLYANRYSK